MNLLKSRCVPLVLLCLAAAILPSCSVFAGTIPANPPKGSQYGNRLGGSILVYASEEIRYTLVFAGIMNSNTLVMIEHSRTIRKPIILAERNLYLPIRPVSETLDIIRKGSPQLLSGIQEIENPLVGASVLAYGVYIVLVRLGDAGSYAFVDILDVAR